MPSAYDYDADDRLVSVTDGGGVVQAGFLYGDGGKRLVKTEFAPVGFGPTNSGYTERYYISPNYEVEVRRDPSTGAWEQAVTRHIDAPGIGIVATITEAGLSTAPTSSNVMAASASPMAGDDRRGSPTGTWFYHSNHLGSTNVVTDDEGAVVSRFVYDPFGRRDGRSVGYGAVARQYTGQVLDSTTGLYHYGARSYLPEAGVFLTADKHADGTPYLSGGVFNPAGLNRFAYAYNNPIRYNDPTGHAPAGGGCKEGEPLPQQYPPSKLAFLNRPTLTRADVARANAQAELRAKMDAQPAIGAHGTKTVEWYKRQADLDRYSTVMGAAGSGPVGAAVFETTKALGANDNQAASAAHAANGVFMSVGGTLGRQGSASASLGTPESAGLLALPSGPSSPGAAGGAGAVGPSPRFVTNPAGVSLDLREFQGLTRNPGTASLGRSGAGRALTGPANSYTATSGGHRLVYGPDGRLKYDVSRQRIKAFEWNQAPNGKWYPRTGSDLKFPEVPQPVLDNVGL